ncbi:unnamed protein product [Amoebophrya sp. A25]|nr:unnamed protein product [Amoebophrya sp. A25]|eukprot:GSA25T00008119001.1
MLQRFDSTLPDPPGKKNEQLLPQREESKVWSNEVGNSGYTTSGYTTSGPDHTDRPNSNYPQKSQLNTAQKRPELSPLWRGGTPLSDAWTLFPAGCAWVLVLFHSFPRASPESKTVGGKCVPGDSGGARGFPSRPKFSFRNCGRAPVEGTQSAASVFGILIMPGKIEYCPKFCSALLTFSHSAPSCLRSNFCGSHRLRTSQRGGTPSRKGPPSLSSSSWSGSRNWLGPSTVYRIATRSGKKWRRRLQIFLKDAASGGHAVQKRGVY